jgi:hypothetical protein
MPHEMLNTRFLALYFSTVYIYCCFVLRPVYFIGTDINANNLTVQQFRHEITRTTATGATLRISWNQDQRNANGVSKCAQGGVGESLDSIYHNKPAFSYLHWIASSHSVFFPSSFLS